ncbi:MAG: hypothetical protein NT120_01420 [Candidatus Aenigmarchaeota archaeon]|nr:hypothetical protein [Candidatus Aenigmarchaeota archaeon]
MKDVELKIIMAIAVIGTVFVVFTAKPEPMTFVDQKTIETNYDLLFMYNTIRYPTYVQITNPGAENVTIGINLGTTSLDFGVVPGNGGTVKKEINLTTKDDKASRVGIKVYGNIKPLMSFDQNDFILTGKRSIPITINTGTYGEGNYTGEIDITIQRSKYGILNFILGY